VTAPRGALRAMLSEVVGAAHGQHKPSGVVPALRIGAAEAAAAGAASAPSYWVRTSDGKTSGPFTYAKMAEAISTSRFGITDAIALAQGGPFRPLEDHPDLFRHVPASSLSERTANRNTPGEPDREWDLADGAIVSILGRLVCDRATGLVLCENGGVRKEVYLQDGAPEFVTSNLATELLGEFLVARGVITRGELDMALAVMPRFEGRLGDTLTALGLVEPVQLFRHIAAQVQEKLLDVFTWTGGRATYWKDVKRPQSGFPLGIDPWRLLVDGVDRRLARGLPDPLAERGEEKLVAAKPLPVGLEPGRLPLPARVALEVSRTPVKAKDLVARMSDPRGADPRAGRREIVMLVALRALRWA
jgi:serine/threonine-protein kinase